MEEPDPVVFFGKLQDDLVAAVGAPVFGNDDLEAAASTFL